MLSLKCLVVLIGVTIVINPVDSGKIVDIVKDGVDAINTKVYCGLHKLKELVKQHEHDVDPCTGQPRDEFKIDVRMAPDEE